MTAEPKFVPEEAVEITPDGTARLSVRLIDSVGYLVDGAIGATENGQPRMVTTPWADTELPMEEAAELGTRKVMEEHSTVGLVVTTDGVHHGHPARRLPRGRGTGHPGYAGNGEAVPRGCEFCRAERRAGTGAALRAGGDLWRARRDGGLPVPARGGAWRAAARAALYVPDAGGTCVPPGVGTGARAGAPAQGSTLFRPAGECGGHRLPRGCRAGAAPRL